MVKLATTYLQILSYALLTNFFRGIEHYIIYNWDSVVN